MGTDEFCYWQAYYALNPWGEDVEDARNASLLAQMQNLWSSEKAKLDDYMPKRMQGDGFGSDDVDRRAETKRKLAARRERIEADEEAGRGRRRPLAGG